MAERVYEFVVVGAGRAGTARVRAIGTHPRARLVGVARRSGSPPLDEVLADPRVDAVFVCTPNLLHETSVAAALEAGKHVAVEFPLAEGARAARALFERAARAARILHVEHIELLSPSQAHLRGAVRGLGPPVGGVLRFRGSSAGWIGESRLAGGAGLRAVARLHRAVDLFGPAQLRDARIDPGQTGAYRLQVELAFDRGGSLTLVEERGPGLERGTDWDLVCEGGVVEPPPAERPSGLFERDLEHFIERIETGAPPYVSDERVLHVLGLADAIDASKSPG